MTLSGEALTLSTGFFDLSRAAGATVHSARAGLGEQAASAVEAVRRASVEPGRAAVILLPDEIGGALDAVSSAAAAHVPLVVHVPFVTGDDSSAIAALCETGAAILSTWTSRDAVVTALALHRAAHDSEMPFVQLHDGDGHGALSVLDRASIDAVLGPAHSRSASPVEPDRARVRGFAGRVPFALAAALRATSERAATPVPLLERFETADADEVVVTYGRTFPLACNVARHLRAAGRKVGVLGVRALRPFLAAEVVKSIARSRAVVVLEPFDVAQDPTGPLAACVKGAFFDALTWAPGFPGVGRIPPVVSVTSVRAELSAADVESALAELSNGERARRTVVIGNEA